LRHLWCVRAVILGEQGQAVTEFWEKLFTAVGAGAEASTLLTEAVAGWGPSAFLPKATEDEARSTSKLTAWLRASLSTPGPHLNVSSSYYLQPSLFSATFTGAAPPTSSTPHAWVSTSIKITYTPPFPASLLLTPTAIASYASVGGVFLGLRVALRSTHALTHASRHVEEAIWGRLSLLAVPGIPQTPTYRHALRCTFRVIALARHALSSALRVCTEGVLVAPWAALTRAVTGGVANFSELHALHGAHLHSVLRSALLGEGQSGAKSRLTTLVKLVAGVESAACRFYSVLLAAVDSVVGLAEECAEARVLLHLEDDSVKGRARKCRARTLPLDLNILAHAAEVGLEVHRAFMHVQNAGRALERDFSAMAILLKSK